MRTVALFIFLTSVVACSAYKSPGRKFLEQNASRYSNGILSVRYSCAGDYPEKGMAPIGEVDDQIFAWTVGQLPDERWLLKSTNNTCRFSVGEHAEDPLPTLIRLFRLDEGP